VKIILSSGKEDKRIYFYEYRADGEVKHDVASMKRRMEEMYRKAEQQTGQRAKGFTFDERWLSRVTWRTSGQRLITTSESSQSGSSEIVCTYRIKDDTLTLTNARGGREILVREKK
jgi:hypothetical protein